MRSEMKKRQTDKGLEGKNRESASVTGSVHDGKGASGTRMKMRKALRIMDRYRNTLDSLSHANNEP